MLRLLKEIRNGYGGDLRNEEVALVAQEADIRSRA